MDPEVIWVRVGSPVPRPIRKVREYGTADGLYAVVELHDVDDGEQRIVTAIDLMASGTDVVVTATAAEIAARAPVDALVERVAKIMHRRPPAMPRC